MTHDYTLQRSSFHSNKNGTYYQTRCELFSINGDLIGDIFSACSNPLETSRDYTWPSGETSFDKFKDLAKLNWLEKEGLR